MDPALGGIIGGAVVALIAGLFALKQTRTVEAEKAKAAANTLQVESVKVTVESWRELDVAHRSEIARLNAALLEERAVNTALSQQNERLQREVRVLREGTGDAG